MSFLNRSLTRKDFFKGIATLAIPASATAFAQSSSSSSSTLFVNVKTYGAMGDGSTDDTNAIQNAIQSNAVIFFPAGTYIISSAIQLLSLQNVHIQANGAIIQNNTTTTDSFEISGCEFVTFTGGQYTRSATITASSSSLQHCLFFGNCTDVIVQNAFIYGSPGMGICIVVCFDVKIVNNIIKNTTRDGIYSHYSVNVLYSGNYLENITDDALSMHDYGNNQTPGGYSQAGNSIIVNNKIRNAMRGIASIGLQALTITGNIIDHVVNCGIEVYNTTESFEGPNAQVKDVIISNNIVSYACQSSLTLLGASESDNNQGGGGNAAITVGSFGADYQYEIENPRLANVSVTGNMVNYSGANGYFLNNVDGLVFSNNVAKNCNTSPLPPYTGYIVECWYCTGLSAFNNSVVDTATPPNAIAGCRMWNTSGLTAGWMVEGYTGPYVYVIYPGSTIQPSEIY